MAYTFGGLKPGNTIEANQGNATPTSRSNFGNLRVDAGRNALTGVLGNYMQSYDATATPVYSPISNGSNSGLTLTVPANAVQFYIYIASAVTALIGEDSTYTYGLFLPTATLWGPFDVANQQYIYIKPSSGTNTIYFQFVMV
jgi:hypothetical protein